ncbi:GNAT family N-acetyltransferase [Streptomyces rimosus]|uniref:GNAT family N-acetyltransferase n=1 Tax=Streptomyces rimosus TaxID=1927 RepID=UPI0004C9BB30|nr:GNAT family N-acetyltransferase [Streptomyces rimosus]
MTEIRTPRLLLRRWHDDDLAPMADIDADPRVMRWIDDGSVGQGYASEAAHATLEFALQDRGLDRVISISQVGDDASENIMRKLGMEWESETAHPVHGRPLRVHAIDLTEFQA